MSNPRERKRLADAVRARADGLALVDLLVKIVDGERIHGQKPTVAETLEAAKVLLELGWGKAVQPVKVTVKGTAGVPLPLAPMLAALWEN